MEGDVLKDLNHRARRYARRLLGPRSSDRVIGIGQVPRIEQLNEWQAAFCYWQARRIGVSDGEMRARFLDSLNAVQGGHRGSDYRRFSMMSYALYLPFVSDNSTEVYNAYDFHERMHFLRMLSYGLPDWPADHPVLAAVAGLERVTITDFGCGMAQNSISLGRALRARGIDVRLQLADVSKLQLDFLNWFCGRIAMNCKVARCTEQAPIPHFAPAEVLFAEEVLEHVHDPVCFVEQLDTLIAPSGILLSNLRRHEPEFMHVSPDLDAARDRLLAMGYVEIETQHVFGKGGTARDGNRTARQSRLVAARTS